MPLFSKKDSKASVSSNPTPGKNITPQPSSASLKLEDTRAEGLEAEKKGLSNKDPLDWTVADVGQWLGFMGLGEYRITFIENSIGGNELFELDDRDLMEHLGVAKLGDRKKIVKGVQALKAHGFSDNMSFGSRHSMPSFQGGESRSHRSGTASVCSDNSHTTDDIDSIVEEALAKGPVTVKFYFDSEIRTITIDDPTVDKVKLQAKLEFKQDVIIKYYDSENELVTLAHDDDVKRGVRMCDEGAVLKLQLKPAAFLTEAEAKTLDRMIDPVVITDKKGYIMFFNSAAERVFGYSKKRVHLKNVKLIMTKSDAKQHKHYMKNYLRTGIAQVIGKSRVVVGKHHDGSEFTVRLSLTETNENGFHYFTGTMQKLDDVQQGSPVAMFQVMDNLLDFIVVTSDSGIITYINKAAVKFFGYTPKEVVGQNVKILMPEPFASEHDVYISNYRRSKIAKVMATGREVPVQLKNGTIVPCLLKLTEQEISGRLYFTGVLEPIDARVVKQTKSMLEQEREVLSGLLLPACVIDSNGIIQAWNGQAAKAFGWELREVIGRNISMIMTESDKMNHDGYLKRYMTTRKSNVIGLGRKVVGITKTGDLIGVKLFVTEKKDENGRIFFSGILNVEDGK
jgi:PAS domain S-box-containing protein